MKSAEEWQLILPDGDGMMPGYNHINQNQIKQIQLDAMKEGARRAAEIINNAEVSEGGPLTNESPAAQSRRSLH